MYDLERVYRAARASDHRFVDCNVAGGHPKGFRAFAQLIQDWIHFGMPQSLLRNLVYELSVR
jgi:hypothetical protein